MNNIEALTALRAARADGDIVVPTMGAAREWMALGKHPLDFVLVPSSMGHATSIGLGLALAQPARRVIVLNGDGSLLMNLGSLVSITTARATNLVVVVLENGVYEVTGAQPTPGAGRVDYVALANACGFASTFRFTTLDAWRESLARVLGAPGPTFVALEVEPIPGIKGPRSPGPAPERARRFMAALDAGTPPSA